MDYFLMKQSGTISIPKADKTAASDPSEPSVRFMDDPDVLEQFDYLSAEALVSDRVKLLFEQFLLEQPWQPCVFAQPQKKTMQTFWYLPPLPYTPAQVITASNGTPLAVSVDEADFAKKAPAILRIPNRRGAPFIVVHLSVAESLLRRGYCGLTLVRLPGAHTAQMNS